ncbi:MAG TPA: BTAD domain-containing putative transcriptional regulator [Candidatus Limnocylindria bacterium]|nr:BTAD domain-containing putative transcriptional regulator [Candidatus Limnocylindria bacterium]
MSAVIAAPRLEVRLLGRFELRIVGRSVDLPSRPAQSLLAYLVLTAGTRHRRERLAALLWPDADEENARTYLRQALWRIRKAIPSEAADTPFLSADDLTVSFDPRASYRLDVAEFDRAAPGDELEALAACVGAYGGELLPGFYDEWAVRERERLEALLPSRMERLIDALAERGRWTDVIEWGERWIALGGAPEAAYRALMRAHHERGDRSLVAAAYRRCAEALRREIDVGPSDETRELYTRLTSMSPPRSSGPRLLDLAVEPAPATPPFVGLRHFAEADAALFFGREAVVARIGERMREEPFLAVLGGSGSGKSSILRAGVLPSLRRGPPTRRVFVLTPTARPLEALAAALVADADGPTAALAAELASDARNLRLRLRRSAGDAVFAVDQFEEIFTLCRDAFEREAFVDLLLAAAVADGATRISVVIALRADFYGHCADLPALRGAIAAHQEYIGPMGAEDLRRAIEGPAAKLGWALEPGLADLVLHDAGDEPGALPLVSHALRETWEARRGNTLTIDAYERSGGVRGAVARTAEATFAGLGPEEQQLARGIFLRLTEFGDGTQDTRRRASIDELRSGRTGETSVGHVVQILANARLLTVSEGTVDVAHEALIREWPRLRRWLEDDREALRSRRELTRAALDWNRLGRDAGALYRGARLAQAVELAAQRADDLNDLERAYVDASIAQAEAETREREQVRERELEAARRLAASERRAARALRRRAVYLTLTLFFLAGMAGAALWSAEQARASAAAAVEERQRALVESARTAAGTVASRIRSLADAVSVGSTRSDLVYLLGTGDEHRVAETLRTVQYFAGDVAVLFIARYDTAEIAALPFANAWTKDRADRARASLAGSEPDAAAGCAEWRAADVPTREAIAKRVAEAPVAVSAPYAPLAGDAPSIALAKYDLPCQPYALIAEVSLRRAGEWIAAALAPGDDAYLVDGRGRVLAASRPSEPDYFRDLGLTELVAAALRSEDALLRETTDPLGGGARLAAAAPVSGAGWRVLVLRHAAEPQPQVDPDARVVLGGAVVLAVLLAAAIVRRSLRR